MLKGSKKVSYIIMGSLFFLLSTNFSYAQQKTGTITASSLNLRAECSTSSKVLDTIPKDSEVTIIDSNDEWYNVEYNNKNGWLYKSYVSINEGQTSKEGQVLSKDETVGNSNYSDNQKKIGIVNASMLNMRNGSDTSQELLCQIPDGGKIRIIDSSKDWYKVEFNSKTGWVLGKYVSIIEDNSQKLSKDASQPVSEFKSTPKPTALPVPEPTVTPVTSVIIEPTATTVINVEESDSVKTEVLIEDKTLLIDKTLLPQSPSSSTLETGTIKASSLNVRDGAGTQYGVITKLTKGQRVEIKGQKEGWYKIGTVGGILGWVYGDYVSLSTAMASRGDEVIDKTLIVQPELVDEHNSNIRNEIVKYAKQQLGVKYVYGGSSPKGFDCSGFVLYVYKHFDINMQRVAADQATQGKKISKSDLDPGDAVFFDTNGGHNYINHSGIYVRDGKFIHASSGNSNMKVVISDLTTGFYKESYMTAKRVLN